MIAIEAMRKQYDEAKKRLESRFLDKVEKLQRGDELPPGVMKMVKVFVAVKRKIQPGDKMAGRHGNKGVVSQHRAAGGYAFPCRRHAGRHRAEPARRAEPHERRPDSGDPSRLGLRRSRQASRRGGRRLSARRKDAEPLRDKLGEIYQRPEDIAALDETTLRRSRRESAPRRADRDAGVRWRARKGHRARCWNAPDSIRPARSRSSTGARANPSTAR